MKNGCSSFYGLEKEGHLALPGKDLRFPGFSLQPVLTDRLSDWSSNPIDFVAGPVLEQYTTN